MHVAHNFYPICDGVMKKYFFICREALESKLLLQICTCVVKVIWLSVGGIGQKLSSIELQNYREKRNTFENCSNSNLVLVLEKATDKVTYLASYSNFTEPLVLEKMNQVYFSKSTSNI